MNAFTPDYAVAPGETVAEAIEAVGSSVADVCAGADIGANDLLAAIEAKTLFSAEMMNLLEARVGLPALFVSRLQDNFLNAIARLVAEDSVELLAHFHEATNAGEDGAIVARNYLLSRWPELSAGDEAET